MTSTSDTQPNMSASSEAGATTQECNLNHIPLFPLRYVLTEDGLVNASQGSSCGKAPSSLEAVDNVTFELTRVRAGFVNIYVETGIGEGSDSENKWHVFYHCTRYGDENSSIPRLDTEKRRTDRAFHFYKYQWDNGTPESTWSIVAEDASGNKIQPYPYPYVAIGTSTAWVAYSEERWPAHYFKRAQADAAFRERVMTKVEISETPTTSEKYAPLIDLPKLARSFDANRTSEATYNSGNSIRHTPIKAQNWGFVANSLCAQERGYAVLVNDVNATALDLGAVFTIIQHSKALLAQEYAYPLTTGGIVDGLQKNGAIRTKASTLLPWGETRPHITDFDQVYASLRSSYETALGQLLDKERLLFSVWKSLIDQPGRGTSNDMLTLHAEEFNKAADTDKAEIAGYGLFDISRLVGPFASCEQEQITAYFDALIYEESGASGEGAARIKDLILQMGAIFGSTLEALADADFFYVASWDLCIQTFSARLNKRRGHYYFNGRLVATHPKQIMQFSTEEEAKNVIRKMYNDGFYAAPPTGILPQSEINNVELSKVSAPYPGGQSRTVYSIQTRQVSIAKGPTPEWYNRVNKMSALWGALEPLALGSQ